MRIDRPTSADSPAKPWWILARFGLCTLAISLVLSLLVIPWLHLPLWQMLRRCASIGAACSLWLCIRKFEHRSIRSYGLLLQREGRRQVLAGLAVGVGTLGVLLVIGLANGAYEIVVINDRLRLWNTILSFIPIAVVVSVLEELVFRGYILQNLLPYSKWLAVSVSSALYAVVHVRQLTFNLSAGLELIGLFLLGTILALSYLLTNQLAFSLGLHASLAYGARVNKLLIEFQNPAMAWLVGTTRLVNGVMSWVILLSLWGLVIWRVRIRRKGGMACAS